jgi:hypothetical protein
MKRQLVAAFLSVLSVSVYGQGFVSLANPGGATAIYTNMVGVGGTNGLTSKAASGFFYDVLFNSSTVTTIDSSLQNLTAAGWSDSGITGVNNTGLGTGGKITAMNTLSCCWPAGVQLSFVVVGWSASLGSTWGQVENQLQGAGLVPQFGSFYWTGGRLVSGAFVGATTVGIGTPGTSAGSAFAVFGPNPGQISTPTQLYIVANSPVISMQPTDQSVVVGSNALFSVSAASYASGISYQWVFSGTNLSGGTNSQYIVQSAQLSDAGNYYVVLSNSFGSVTSLPAILQVLPYGAPSIQVNGRPAVGTVTSVHTAGVTISGGFTNGFIFYTLDGTIPTTGSQLYSGPITLTNSTTVQAMSLSSDFSQTSVAPAVNVQLISAFPLQTSTLGNGMISVNPPGSPYGSNSVVVLTAVPAANWAFDHWTGDATGTQNPVSVTMNGPRNVQAVFVQTAYPLTVGTPGGGSVTVNGQAISPNTFYPIGTTVTIAAVTNNGWSFLNWSGDASGTSNPLSLVVSQTNNIQAVFGTVVSTNVSGKGSVDLEPTNPVPFGTLLTATATPAPGYYLKLWGGEASGTNSPTQISITTPTPTVGALFVPVPAGECTLNLVINGSGTVTVNPQQAFYNQGQSVTLTATATNTATPFIGWSRDASGNSNPLTLVLDTNKVVEADFGSSPTVSISPANLVVLLGSNAVLTANAVGLPPLAYQWLSNSFPILNATNSTYLILGASLSEAGNYSVIVTNLYGSATSSVATVTVVVPPGMIEQPTNVTVAAGNIVNLSVLASGTEPLSYQWLNSSGPITNATNSLYTLSSAQTNNGDGYYVVVSNAYGVATSAVATVFVYQSISITVPPASQVVPARATVTFSVIANGYPAPSYQWSFQGTNLLGATSSTLTIPTVGLLNCGEYAVTVGNGYPSDLNAGASLNMSPSITTAFSGVTAIWGQGASLSVAAIGSGALTYQWYKNGLPIDSATNQSFDLSSVQFGDGGLYSVVVSSQWGSITNKAAQLIVNPAGMDLGLYAGINISGVAGYTYEIQYTTDLTETNSWITLTNLTLQQPVELWFDTTTNAAATRYRFYRILPGQ